MALEKTEIEPTWGGDEAESAVADFFSGDAESDDTPEGEEDADPEVDTEGSAEGEGSDEPEGDEDAEEDGEPSETAPASKKWTVTVGTAEGKRKVTIDPTNRKEIERHIQRSYGAEKAVARMHKYRDEVTELRAQTEQRNRDLADWDKFNEAWKSDGIDGIVRLLNGGKGLDEAVEERLAEKQWLADPKTTPEAKAEYYRKREEARAARIQKIAEDKAERAKKDLEKQQEDLALERLRGYAEPAFRKHRFTGKLGDKVLEHKLDSMLWKSIESELDDMRSRGVAFTSENVAATIKDAAQVLQAVVRSKATKQATQMVKNTKAKAAGAVQSAARRGSASLASSKSGEIDFSDPERIAAAMLAGTRKRR